MKHEQILVFPESPWEGDNPRERFAALYQAVIHPGLAYLLTELPDPQTTIDLRWGEKLTITDIARRYNADRQNDTGHVPVNPSYGHMQNGSMHHLRKVDAVRQVAPERYTLTATIVKEAAEIARRYFTEHAALGRSFGHMSHYDTNPYDGGFSRAEIILMLGDTPMLTAADIATRSHISPADLKNFLNDLETKQFIQQTDGAYQLTPQAHSTVYAKLFAPLATLSGISGQRTAIPEEEKAIPSPLAQVDSVELTKPTYLGVMLPPDEAWNTIEKELSMREAIVLAAAYQQVDAKGVARRLRVTEQNLKTVLQGLIGRLNDNTLSSED